MAERLAALAVVLLALVALGLSAAALSTTAPSASAGSGDAGTGSSETVPRVPESSPTSTLSLSFLSSWYVRALSVLLWALVFLGILRYRSRVLPAGMAALAFVAVTILVIAVIAWIAGGHTPTPATENLTNASMAAQGGGGDGSGGGSGSASSARVEVPRVLGGVVGIVLATAVAALFYASRSVDDTEDDDVTPEDGSHGGDDGNIGAAAGRAAAHIQDTDGPELSNAVYEAWYEMTTALDVEGQATATPGEFADAARAAGIEPGAVDDLTEVFETVRYGREPPGEYERQALDALERIEANHGVSRDGPSNARVSGDEFDGTGGGRE